MRPITTEEQAFDTIKLVFEDLSMATPSRELSLVKTKLEEAMMWLNKDRANKGQLEGSETHVV